MSEIKIPNSHIRLFVGLGNPSDKYEKTRHNAGFWFIDSIAQQSPLSIDIKMYGAIAKLSPHNDRWLLKPNTFMNASGKAVAAVANYYKLKPEEILIIHDELDLPPGQVRLKFGGGHGGHNGLRDIHAALNTPNYWRLRIGIGRPLEKNEVIHYVLKAPHKDEQNAIDDSIIYASHHLNLLLQGEFETAMLKLHTQR